MAALFSWGARSRRKKLSKYCYCEFLVAILANNFYHDKPRLLKKNRISLVAPNIHSSNIVPLLVPSLRDPYKLIECLQSCTFSLNQWSSCKIRPKRFIVSVGPWSRVESSEFVKVVGVVVDGHPRHEVEPEIFPWQFFDWTSRFYFCLSM